MHCCRSRLDADDSTFLETRRRTNQVDRMLEFKMKVRRFEADNRCQEHEQKAVTSSAADAISASSAPPSTKSAVTLTMLEDLICAVVASLTSSREFGKTRAASIDVENRPKQVTTACSPFLAGAHL